MSGFRFCHRCKKCKRIVNDNYKFYTYHAIVCKKCGSIEWERCIARPKLFGLLGWVIADKKIKD